MQRGKLTLRGKKVTLISGQASQAAADAVLRQLSELQKTHDVVIEADVLTFYDARPDTKQQSAVHSSDSESLNFFEALRAQELASAALAEKRPRPDSGDDEGESIRPHKKARDDKKPSQRRDRFDVRPSVLHNPLYDQETFSLSS